VLIGGLLLVGASASAKDKKSKSCTNGLVPTVYDCDYLVEGKTNPGFMRMLFTRFSGPEATGPELLLLTGPESRTEHLAWCACGAKKADPSKGEKVGFGEGKAIECVTWTGAHFVGPENFDFGAAAYRGEPKKGAIEKGEGVDTNGKAMVFRCFADN
jgi:hypothetical protein